MEEEDDRTVIEALTAIRGIGRWSAQAFLMRQLHRPDILPPEDMGIRRATADAWRHTRLPTVGEMRSTARTWSPYRSYASALLWRSLKPADELSDPKARALEHIAGSTGARPAGGGRRRR
jgi:DNA-3-methyladenine glycosylase II